MPEKLSFHFEGALADGHRLNFYESARFQYAAARLLVKLAQFRQNGRFTQKITNTSNYDIQLVGHSDGSFNINVESPDQGPKDAAFLKMPVSELLAYISERLVEKVKDANASSDDVTADGASKSETVSTSSAASLDKLVEAVLNEEVLPADIPETVMDLVKRRVAERDRERILQQRQEEVARIDFARSQKLIAMSAPLIKEMATAFRRSANTLEVRSATNGRPSTVLFFDHDMASEIETATVDPEITPTMGNIIQFNKDNGWGKFRLENEIRVISFSVPSDILARLRARFIDSMQNDMVNLQAYHVKDRSNELVRLLVVGFLANPIE